MKKTYKILSILCIGMITGMTGHSLKVAYTKKIKKFKKLHQKGAFSEININDNIIMNLQEKTYNIQNELSEKYPVLEEKSFVFCIPSYNNEKFCEKNLSSALTQNYSNYRVIYIDDCSNDKTYVKIKNLIKKYDAKDKVKLIHNKKRMLKVYNVFHALQDCRDDEIVVMLDGDDWLSHEGVLNHLNRYYANPDVWVTYGIGVIHPDYERLWGKPLPDEVYEKNLIRNYDYCISMPRTFYAGLFKKIKEQDLKYGNDFYSITGDLAIIYPIIEMAGKHVLCVNEVLYVINHESMINDFKLNYHLQLKMDYHIRTSCKYNAIDSYAEKPQIIAN
jgi:glycosyltransferase involved in cell wall biosynthesis